MNDLQIFQSEEFGQVRTVEIDGEPWFVGKDIAISLGYQEPTKAARERVDEEDRGVSIIDTPSGAQQMIVINESGLYSLILGSRLPNAKKFKRWVTSEVLPSIRKTGGYHLPQTYSEALRELAAQAEENERLIEQNEALEDENQRYVEEIGNMQPQIDYLELICKSPERLNATQIAAEYGMQAAEFNKLLNKFGFIKKTNKKWVPTAKIADKGYMYPEVYEYDKENHKTSTEYYWNQEGRKAIYFLFTKNGIFPLKERQQRYVQMTLDLRR